MTVTETGARDTSRTVRRLASSLYFGSSVRGISIIVVSPRRTEKGFVWNVVIGSRSEAGTSGISIQPLVAKSLLPLLGGTPMVWNTCVVFFQALVLAGYGAAHLIAPKRGRIAAVWIYVLLLAAGLAFLPVAFDAEPAASQGPITWLFAE